MKYLIANWKMNLSSEEEIQLTRKVKKITFDAKRVKIIILPSFLSLQELSKVLDGTSLQIGAQDCFWEDKGAYTGEVSPKYLNQLNCQYVLIGHSERRQYLEESHAVINKKLKAVIDNQMTPILCVGETADERHSGSKDHIVRRQVELALDAVELVGSQRLIVAYEPVWAIGRGTAASIEEAVYMHQVIRQTLIDLFPVDVVQKNTAVIYGGSVDLSNTQGFLKEEIISGVLIGGASLDFKKFQEIVEMMKTM